jgi:hypothetical protein
MIQPNEKLLPGNVVMWHDKPYTLDAKDIWHISIDIKTFRNVLSPIPLTPEILVQWCGFTKGFYAYGAIMGKCNVSIDFEDGFLAIVDSNGSAVNVKLPDHLHTLQNTVYFLSGEEMPVNIPNN